MMKCKRHTDIPCIADTGAKEARDSGICLVGRAWGHLEQRDGQAYRALNPPTTVLWVGTFFTYPDGVYDHCWDHR